MDKDKALEITSIFKITFGTPQGQECLKHLQRAFIDREIAKDGMDLLSIGIRQGEANVIRKILEEVNRDGR